MTHSAAQRLAKLQDNDRAKLERIGLPAARRIGIKARTSASWAVKLGHDPKRAVRAVLLGNQHLGHVGLPELLTTGMVAAHLAGRRRSLITVAAHKRGTGGYKLAGSVYDEALKFLRRRLGLNPAAVDTLRTTYGATALRVAQQATDAVETKLQEVLADTTAQGLGVRNGVKALGQAFDAAGMAQDDHTLQAIFRTQTQTAYSAGRWQSNQDAAVDEILWGYQYVAIEDDRTTDLCESLDGTILPKDDGFWSAYWPPNHWSCRSTTIEVFDEGEAVAPPADADDPQAGFAYNPGEVFQADLAAVAV